eukprot:6196667-Pleurochrysis_carterae.AAC.3
MERGAREREFPACRRAMPWWLSWCRGNNLMCAQVCSLTRKARARGIVVPVSHPARPWSLSRCRGNSDVATRSLYYVCAMQGNDHPTAHIPIWLFLGNLTSCVQNRWASWAKVATAHGIFH